MVSIVVPVYNSELYLTQCLRSIQQQTYRDIEVLCVDDGSTDASRDIINTFIVRDRRFRYIFHKHTNAGDSRNIGIAASKGDYLLFLDSDDFVSPDLVENVLTCAVDTDADVTVFKYKLFDERKSRMSRKSYGIHIAKKRPFTLLELRKGKFTFTNIAVWNKLYRAAWVKEVKLEFKSRTAINDVFFSWCALIFARKIALCRYAGVYYRVNTGSSLSDTRVNTPDCIVEAFVEINEYLKVCGVWGIYAEDVTRAEKRQLKEFNKRKKLSK